MSFEMCRIVEEMKNDWGLSFFLESEFLVNNILK